LIVLMSGEIAAGKTAVALELEVQHGFQRVRSGSYLAALAPSRGLTTDRHGLQKMGDLLDQETEGAWIAELARDQIAKNKNVDHWVLDSARRDFQVSRFRELFGREVIHVHLMAADNVLKSRFRTRAFDDNRDSGTDYASVKASQTEQHAKGLGTIADITANSGAFTPNQLAQLIGLSVRLQSERATS